MERKLVKQGRNALTVTLPSAWLKRRGLQPRGSVRLEELQDSIRITPATAPERRTITIDLRNADRSTLWHKTCAAYVEGYDIIEVIHTSQKDIDEFGSKLVGMITEEHTATRIVFRSIVAQPDDNMAALLRRAGHMFAGQASVLEEIAHGTATFEQLKQRERVLDSTLLYCQRMINKYERTERGYQLFLFCAWLEIAGDHLTIIAQHIGKDVALAKRIAQAARSYVDGIFSNDYKKLYTTLRTFRSSIEKRTFVDGATYIFADTLYNNISVFIEDKKYDGHQNI